MVQGQREVVAAPEIEVARPGRAAPALLLAALLSAAPRAAKPLDYVCYSPYREGQAPGGPSPTEAQIRADLALIAPLAKGIRTYAAAGIHARIPDLAREAGLEIYAGAWIGTDSAANLAEVDALIALAKSGNPAIKGLIVGNEALLRHDVTAPGLIAYLQRVRDAKTGIPVSTADIYQDLIEHAAELEPVVDYALCHVHPYWEAVAAAQGAARVLQAWRSVQAKYPGKPVLVGETGYPTAGPSQGGAAPGEAAQAEFLADLIGLAAREGMPVMWFEAFDEAWKGADWQVEPHWGLWNADRSEKPAVGRARAAVGLARPARLRRAAADGMPVLRADAAGRLRPWPADRPGAPGPVFGVPPRQE
jgi:exo-beta-1,3-glucanase (GH17 family)